MAVGSPTKRKKLGELLIEAGVLDETSLASALEHAKKNRQRIGQAVIAMQLGNDDQVMRALAKQGGHDFVDLENVIPNAQQLDLVPKDLALRYQVVPLERNGRKLKVVLSDPNDLETLDMLRFRLSVEPVVALAPKGRIKAYLDKYLSGGNLSLDVVAQAAGASIDIPTGGVGTAARETDAQDAPIIKLVSMYLQDAVNSRASDIHIEPFADRVRVRYRIDGVCIEKDRIDKNLQNSVISRLKLMSGMDIAEKRLTQDGRIKMSVTTPSGEKRDIDFRVSSLPAYHGESLVLRILRPDAVSVGIPALGFDEDDYAKFSKIIKRPNGMFLVTGPTGSGKTTTLYAALKELNRPDRKLITAEDPVEYNFPGINQCQIRENIGFTFQAVLRSMLRQAPNIILVGEIRDKLVGEIAIQAALTGHLVFSTLHTNDAPSAITRMIDMGLKPFLVASSIMGVLAQRLVRKICEDCKVVDPAPNKMHLKILGFSDQEIATKTFYKGQGCKKCLNIGYKGRVGIFEMMMMNSQIRELAYQRSPTNLVRKAAIASGMKTLLDDGKRKVLRGVTTAAELMSVTQAEGLVTADEAA